MPQTKLLEILLHVIVFLLGAGIGSFLNVVIYRLPIGLSVNDPKRSFCPICKTQIPWCRNLPLITWLAQRGRCASCQAPIPFRYFFVELLTGVIFYAIFMKFGGPWPQISQWGDVVLLYWIFAALLIAGTFIDIDHFILPHSITLGGLMVGLLGSWITPELMQQSERGQGILVSFVSACIGLGILWTVVELGKLAFGRIRQKYEKAVPWSITEPPEDGPLVFKVADEELTYDDIFTRPSDRLLITAESAMVNEIVYGKTIVEVRLARIKVKPADGSGPEVLHPIEEVKKISGTTTEIVIPREAMGFGDVLLLAMIGSFLGWQAVLFTLVAGSFLGSVVALGPRIFGKTQWTAQIPFGPYLAGGAMIWLFYGPQFVRWYLETFRFGGGETY